MEWSPAFETSFHTQSATFPGAISGASFELQATKDSISALAGFGPKTLTCNHSSGEVDVDDAGGEGGQDHPHRGEEASHHHHRATAEAVHQYAAQRT